MPTRSNCDGRARPLPAVSKRAGRRARTRSVYSDRKRRLRSRRVIERPLERLSAAMAIAGHQRNGRARWCPRRAKRLLPFLSPARKVCGTVSELT